MKRKPLTLRAKWARISNEDLKCLSCKGRGQVFRDEEGQWASNPRACSACDGNGIPPVPLVELKDVANV